MQLNVKLFNIGGTNLNVNMTSNNSKQLYDSNNPNALKQSLKDLDEVLQSDEVRLSKP